MVAIRVMREADLTTELHTRRSSSEEPHRPGQTGPTLNQPTFDLKAPDRYVKLLNFKNGAGRCTPK